MTYPVKWFSGDMEGAPALSSGVAGAAHTTNPGSLIALLKAVLVTGFGLKAVSTLTYDNQSSTITATVAAGHKYLVDQVIEISGAVESGFNGEFRVLSVTSTNIVMGIDNGAPSSSSATGSISIKTPSLGWAVEFEDSANYKIIFKRTDPNSTPLRLYIDNSAWTSWNNNYGYLAKISIIENPTDINTFTTVYEGRWPCSHSYGTPGWGVVGDSSLFYFLPAYGIANTRGCYFFGDINSVRPGDNYHCIFATYPLLVNTSAADWNTATDAYYNDVLGFGVSANRVIARSYHQLPGSVAISWKGLNSYFGEGMSFPNPADNGFYLGTSPVPVFDDLSYRGDLPGVVVPYSSPVSYDKKNIIDLPASNGGMIRLIMANRQAAGGYPRLIGFDIKGPWR